MACYSSIFGITSNNLNDLKFNDVLDFTKEQVDEIEERLAISSLKKFKKCIKGFKIKKEFELFVKENVLSEREKYILFLKNYVSNLFFQLNKYLKIVKEEDIDKTIKKHREIIEKIIPIINKIGEIHLFFDPNLNNKKAYNYYYFKGVKKDTFKKQHSATHNLNKIDIIPN